MSATEDFLGRIGRTLADSEPWWAPTPKAPAGAPNTLFVLLDDVGFADLGCYGSEINTPNIDALAASGVRYSNFHVTSMCSPTRACLLTGRNAHSVGVGAIAEWSSGFPGYQGRISKHAATIAEMLSEQAYGTYAIGKWHLTNLANYVAAGPHDDWPLGRGFSRWYGFLGGYTDHWHPDLHRDNHPIQIANKDGYHLTEDLIDQAIDQIRDHVTTARGRPFFQYVALGAGHWPHQAPRSFIDRYRGRFDMGWDKVRDARLSRQKTMGLVPGDTRLPPRNTMVEPWDELPPSTRTVCARFQEAYAGFMEHADSEIGRLIAFLREIGRLDDTIVLLLSDNGASGEGGPTGALNIRKHLMLEKETAELGLVHLDRIGSEFSSSHYPMGWAQASNTPLKLYKKNTYGGGVRAPLVVHWPKGIKERNGIATQYHHVVDVVPTILELLKIEAPPVYRGVQQIPVQGTSFAYTFADPASPTRKQVQHYEMVGDRAIWQQGWKAVAHHKKGAEFDDDKWELFHTDLDFSETQDLAAVHPDRLQRLLKLWWAEAETYGVLPLDDRDTERAFAWFKANAPTRYEYLPGMARVDRLLIPAINERSYSICADVEFADENAEGVLLSCGNRFGGFSLYCKGGFAIFEYVYSEAVSHVLRAPIVQGRHALAVSFRKTGKAAGKLTLSVDKSALGSVEIPKVWSTYGVTSGLTCGFAGVPVSTAYDAPFTFNGRLHKITVDLLDDDREDAGEAARAMHQQE